MWDLRLITAQQLSFIRCLAETVFKLALFLCCLDGFLAAHQAEDLGLHRLDSLTFHVLSPKQCSCAWFRFFSLNQQLQSMLWVLSGTFTDGKGLMIINISRIKFSKYIQHENPEGHILLSEHCFFSVARDFLVYRFVDFPWCNFLCNFSLSNAVFKVDEFLNDTALMLKDATVEDLFTCVSICQFLSNNLQMILDNSGHHFPCVTDFDNGSLVFVLFSILLL